MQLLIKLSESLDILEKNRAAEHDFGIQVWMSQQIATFAGTTLFTLAIMIAMGQVDFSDEEGTTGASRGAAPGDCKATAVVSEKEVLEISDQA